MEFSTSVNEQVIAAKGWPKGTNPKFAGSEEMDGPETLLRKQQNPAEPNQVQRLKPPTVSTAFPPVPATRGVLLIEYQCFALVLELDGHSVWPNFHNTHSQNTIIWPKQLTVHDR